MLVDAHAHLDRYLETRLDEVLALIDEHHILTLTNAVDIASYRHNQEIASRSTLVIPGFGVHPWEAPLFVDDLGRLDPLLDEAPYIGEAGLDRRFVAEAEQYPAQQAVFEYQLTAAAGTGKVVMLHTSGAERQVLDTLAAYDLDRVVIHWYQGPLDVLEGLIAAGCWFTVGVELLLSDHIARVAELIPMDRLLTETDNPGGPEWLTRKLEMPTLVMDISRRLAEVKDVEPDELQRTVVDNFRELVGGDTHFDPWRSAIEGG